MAVDPAMVDAMLGTFRDLLAQVRAQGSNGADVDEMATALGDMEALATQLSDVTEFSTTLANGGYYTRFTDAYTRVMTSGPTMAAMPDDATLLAQTLAAYEGSAAPPELLERILAIGRSGVSYPVFLRRLEEEGLNDVLAGSVAPSRDSLVAMVEHHRSTGDPARLAEAEAFVAAHDSLAAESPFGSVDPFAFELRRFRIAWVHAPGIACRDAIVQRLPRLLDHVIDWLDAHTSWAPHDDRFIGTSPAETQRNVERARECNPGFYAVRAAQFAEMFGPEPWWQRPELAEERAAGRILWTDPRMALAIDAIPSCVPLVPAAPPELVSRAETFGPNAF